jgi:hypothetical protein
MKKYQIASVLMIFSLLFYPLHTSRAGLTFNDPAVHESRIIGVHQMSLDTRHPAPYANAVYRDNILLAISYLSGQTKKGEPVNWEQVRKLSSYSWTIHPGKSFAFHDGVLPEFAGSTELTTNAHFGGDEGFKSDGFLIGNGVCHLASLIEWVAEDAQLSVKAPTNHDFAVIPEIPREHGVAIYSTPGNPAAGANQNLYVTNNTGRDVTFTFSYDGHNLTLSVSEIK